MKMKVNKFDSLLDLIDLEINLTKLIKPKSKGYKTWTKDYKEGYMDGLKRTIELKNEIGILNA